MYKELRECYFNLMKEQKELELINKIDSLKDDHPELLEMEQIKNLKNVDINLLENTIKSRKNFLKQHEHLFDVNYYDLINSIGSILHTSSMGDIWEGDTWDINVETKVEQTDYFDSASIEMDTIYNVYLVEHKEHKDEKHLFCRVISNPYRGVVGNLEINGLEDKGLTINLLNDLGEDFTLNTPKFSELIEQGKSLNFAHISNELWEAVYRKCIKYLEEEIKTNKNEMNILKSKIDTLKNKNKKYTEQLKELKQEGFKRSY